MNNTLKTLEIQAKEFFPHMPHKEFLRLSDLVEIAYSHGCLDGVSASQDIIKNCRFPKIEEEEKFVSMDINIRLRTINEIDKKIEEEQLQKKLDAEERQFESHYDKLLKINQIN